ncbi:MAG: hypothetical protein ACREUF_13225, partial [Solimonas sp.]
MHSRLTALWQGEIAPIDNRHSRLGQGFVVLFALWFALSFLGWTQYIAYLGPGLGDDWNLQPLWQLWQGLGAAETGGALIGYTLP